MRAGMSAGHEILEHTADVGIRAWGTSLAEALEETANGLVEILGAGMEGRGDVHRVRASARDAGGLVVDFLNELLLLHENEEAGFARVRVLRASPGPDGAALDAEVELAPLESEPEGTAIKAATYHQLAVASRPDGGTEVQVYLDV